MDGLDLTYGGRMRACWRIGLMLALLWSGNSTAQAPASIVIPYTAGSSIDHLGRLLAQHLAVGLNQPVVVDNRPGGSGLIGARYVVHAAPDGRTILLGSSFLATAAATQTIDFDPQRDLTPIIKLTRSENFLVVHGGLEVNTLADLKHLARQRKGGVNCAGVAGQMMLSCERLRMLLGGQMETIPFQGASSALTALAGGHVDVMFAPRAALAPFLPAQRIRILAAATDAAPAPPYEHLPLLKETWAGMVMNTSHGLFAPAGTPSSVVAGLNRELNRILALPEVRSELVGLGYQVVGGPPVVLAKTLAHDIKFYRKIVSELALPSESWITK